MSFQAWTVERGRALLLGTYPHAGDCDRVLRNGFDGGAVVHEGEIVRGRKGTDPASLKLIAKAAREHHRDHPEIEPAAVEETPAVELPADPVTPETTASAPAPDPHDNHTAALVGDSSNHSELVGAIPARAPLHESPIEESPTTTSATTHTEPEESAAMAPNQPFLPPLCKVRGCSSPIPTSAARELYKSLCATHRSRAQTAIAAGRTTEADAVTYLGEVHPRGRPVARIAPPNGATTKRSSGTPTKKREVSRIDVKVTRKATATPEQSVEVSDDTIQVTIALPSDVARAHRLALAVGLQALEALAELRSDSPISETSAAVALLPARGAR